MGAPVETGIENFEEVILSLSASDPAKLIGWISESLVEEIESEPPAQKIEPGTESTPEDNVEWPPANAREADVIVAADVMARKVRRNIGYLQLLIKQVFPV